MRQAIDNPKIVHYAGRHKPWKNPNLLYAEYFWKYARQTVFYEELLYKNCQNFAVNKIKTAIGRGFYLQYIKHKLTSLFTFGSARIKHYNEARKFKNKIKEHQKFFK